jgi:WD40 repeat protein
MGSSAGNGASGEILLVLAGHGDEVRDIDWAPDGARIATIGQDGTARVWDATTGTELSRLHGAGGYLEYVAWSPSGDQLVTEGGRRAIRVWDLSGGALRLPDQGTVVFDARWSPDGRRLATTCLDGAARIWDAASGEELLRLAHPAALYRFDWSPDGNRIVTVQGFGLLSVWDAVSGELLFRIATRDTGYFQPAWSPDGSRIVAAGNSDNAVNDAFVYDALTGEKITTVRDERCNILRMPSWSPNGDRFVSGCSPEDDNLNTPALIWDAATSENLLELPSQDGPSYSTEWSPDGTRIAVCYTDGPCRVWDVSTALNTGAATGKVLLTFAEHTASVSDVAWSPDGARIASADESGTVRVWDAVTGVEVLSFMVPANAETVSWSPDGNHVIVAGYFNTPVVRRVWSSTEELIAHARECCVARELTDEEREQFGLPLR